MITLQDVSVIFEKNTPLEAVALHPLHLTFQPGDFVTLVGGNGAGKSTLLKLISGEVTPATGRILFGEKEVTRLSVSARAAYIGHVYQDPRLGTCPELTIEENLSLAMRRGRSRGLQLACRRSFRAVCQALLKTLHLGLEHRLQDQVAMLSGGQRQALSLIMATCLNPEILLLDEHTAALDLKTAQVILELTQQVVTAHRMTAIMITHHLTQALSIGNRTLLMQSGRVIRDMDRLTRKQYQPEDLIQYF